MSLGPITAQEKYLTLWKIDLNANWLRPPSISVNVIGFVYQSKEEREIVQAISRLFSSITAWLSDCQA